MRKLDSSGIAAGESTVLLIMRCTSLDGDTIRVEYEIHEFKPRASMIKDMSKEARDKATKEADELLVE